MTCVTLLPRWETISALRWDRSCTRVALADAFGTLVFDAATGAFRVIHVDCTRTLEWVGPSLLAACTTRGVVVSDVRTPLAAQRYMSEGVAAALSWSAADKLAVAIKLLN